jgi:DNA-binding transcriptional MocR family regulator
MVLERHAEVLAIEDDYVGDVSGTPYLRRRRGSRSWAVLRSLSKVLGPDLRIALVAGDPTSVRRVAGRQLLGPGWVSHLLQRLAVELLDDPDTAALLAAATEAYRERREALVGALAERGVAAHGRSGFGVWVPARDEATVAQLLLEAGWLVSAGSRYRFESPPGIRITTSRLDPGDAPALADAVSAALRPRSETYAG